MKVLLLCYRGNPFCGGQGVYLYYLSRELYKLGVEVDIVVGPPYPDPMDEWATVYKLDNLNIWGLKTRDIPSEKLKRVFSPLHFFDYIMTRLHFFPELCSFSFRAFFFIRNLLRNNHYDIIHDVNTLGWGLVPSRCFGIPIVTTVHHPLTRDKKADLETPSGLWHKIAAFLFYPVIMQRCVIKTVDRVITSFAKGVDELVDAFAVKRTKVTVVYNGLDVDYFMAGPGMREKESLLFVGNTEDNKKGVRFLLEAVSNLPETVKLYIVDEGPPYKNSVYTLVKKLGIEKRVFFTGKVDNATLLHLYRTKTILVMPSLYEGFGLPAAEAMACGTPVVVTAAGALDEVVDETTGVIVEPADSQALCSAIKGLLEDPQAQKEMGRQGRKKVENNFSWQIAARNTLDVYKEVIGK